MIATPLPALHSEIDLYVKTVLEKKARDVVVLDVRDLTSVADVFIICSGGSNRQVTAIGEHIKLELKKMGIMPISTDGFQDGHWVLMDYGHVIIHVFYDSVRRFYDLEGLWADADRIKPPSLIKWRELMEAEADEYDTEEYDDDRPE